MEYRDLVMIQPFSQWHKKAILNFFCLQWKTIMSLTQVIQIGKDFRLHISHHETTLSDIICHSSTMVLLHGIKKNYLINIMRLYVHLSREFLEFGRKNGGFFVIFQYIVSTYSREWSWLQ
ncbi:unnamed protein product [Brassica rapa subsp. narinosa]